MAGSCQGLVNFTLTPVQMGRGMNGQKRVHRQCVLLLLAVVGAASCGDCNGVVEPPPGSEVFPELQPAVEAMLGALCDFGERCPSEYYAIAYRSREECMAIFNFVFTCRLNSEEDADDNNIYTVERRDFPNDPDALQACADWLSTAPCDALDGQGDGACTVLAALFADDDSDPPDPPPTAGQSCEQDSCVEGLQCLDLNSYPEHPVEQTDYCRTCVAPSQAGGECAAAATFCDHGDPDHPLYCSATTGLCTAPLGAGGTCTAQQVPCGTDFYCEETSGSCLARLAAGDTCVEYDQRCAIGLHCSVDHAVCAVPEADGAGCYQDSDCTNGFCNRRLGDPSTSYGKCDPAGFEGDPCTDGRDCRDNGNCINSMCIVERMDGEPCVRDFQCWDHYCDEIDRHCGKRSNGQSCTEDDDCDRRHCDLTTLRCGAPDGTPCNTDYDCQSNKCDSYSDACVPQHALGESCNGDAECASNKCWGSVCILSCYSDEQCATGEHCDWNSNVCLPPGDTGAACEADTDCLSGWCNWNEQCQVKPGLGDPCTGYGDCYPRGYCSNSVCQPKNGPGEACESYDSCLDPYICLEGRCRRMGLECAPAPAGSMCTFLMVCAADAYCDRMDNFTCKTRKAPGLTCSSGDECRDGLVCGPSGCATAPAADQPCISGQCATGLWCDAMTSPNTCRARAADGQPCDRDEACLSGNCDGTSCQPPWGTPTCVMP